MVKLSTQGVVRKVLTGDPEMPIDEVIRRAKVQGLRVPDDKIRHAVHNLRNPVRAQVAAAAKVASIAARETAPSKETPVASTPVSAPAATTPVTPDLAGVLSNVALVNKVVGLCGGVENARETAGAVQACGSLEAFLQHLELVATIRGGEPTS